VVVWITPLDRVGGRSNINASLRHTAFFPVAEQQNSALELEKELWAEIISEYFKNHPGL
jgi:hypothetical protein